MATIARKVAGLQTRWKVLIVAVVGLSVVGNIVGSRDDERLDAPSTQTPSSTDEEEAAASTIEERATITTNGGATSSTADAATTSALSTLPPSTTSAPGPAIVLTVEIDRNQVNYYAVASSPMADFAAETLACARRGKLPDNERYCFLFPTLEAFEFSNVNVSNGEMSPVCWIAFGGAGTDANTVEPEHIQVDERFSYDISGCPPY